MIIVAFFWSFFVLPLLAVALVAMASRLSPRVAGHLTRLLVAFQPFKPAVGQADPIWTLAPTNNDTAADGEMKLVTPEWPEWVKAEMAGGQHEARPNLPPLAFITKAELMEKIATAREEAALSAKQGEFHVMVERRGEARPTVSQRPTPKAAPSHPANNIVHILYQMHRASDRAKAARDERACAAFFKAAHEVDAYLASRPVVIS